MRQLRIKKKFYEFYAAPITKFWSHSMAYMAFLMIYTYTVLIRMLPEMEWNEYYIIAYVATFGSEKIREVLASVPVEPSSKFSAHLARPSGGDNELLHTYTTTTITTTTATATTITITTITTRGRCHLAAGFFILT